MPVPPLLVDEDSPELRTGLQRIREELEVPGPHGAEAVAEAEQAARRVLGGLDASVGVARADARAFDFVTIDPPGSRDLDQALHLERRPGGGFRVRYAIADVASFVVAGSALDEEVWRRGVTFYLPDARAPLHPAVLGEGAASLVPGEDRPAVVWTIDLDRDGVAGDARLERAVVRSRAQLTYAGVQAAVDAGRAEGTEALLAEVGPLRQAIEAERGGVSLDLPTQRVVRDGDAYHLEREDVVPAMGWNAQISLLTGMTAGLAMLDAGVGLLRTLPPPPREVVRTVRNTAEALGVDWPDGAGYAAVLRGLDSAVPAEAALLLLAARGLRGAGYLALGGTAPEKDDLVEHAAVAAPYAHVTAPLRRLCDRFAIEACLNRFARGRPAEALVTTLEEVPYAMARATAREGGAARAVIDLVEVLLLAPRVGHRLPLGAVVPVRIDGADLVARKVHLSPA